MGIYSNKKTSFLQFVSTSRLGWSNISYLIDNMPTIQQIERLNKRHSEAASESEQPSSKRKRQVTTPSESKRPLR
jgi:hypothetical protein